MGWHVFDKKVVQRVFLSNQFEHLLPGYSHCSLHVACELKAVLRSDEGDAVFVTVECLQGVAHFQHLVEGSWPCERLEATFNELVIHVRAIMVDAAIEQSFLVFRLHLVHLAHQLNEIVSLLFVVLVRVSSLPGVQLLSMVEVYHDST